MIKIEFKDATQIYGNVKFCILTQDQFKTFVYYTSPHHDKMVSVTPYIPTQDPMLDRSYILSLLNRSQQEDEKNQIKWSKL